MAAIALITGGSGLLGRHVLRHWSSDLEPVPVHRQEADLLQEGAAQALIARLRPQVVLHLAWTASGTDGYRSSPLNALWERASVELAEACSDVGATLFATGTCVDKSVPQDRYTASKVSLRQKMEEGIAARRLCWLRPFYVFDPEVGRPALVADALVARTQGRPVFLRTPARSHDFVHADDVGRGVATAVTHDMRGEVDIGSGVVRSVRQLTEALGVSWSGPDEPTDDGSTDQDPSERSAADLAPLGECGWIPSRTEEFFQRG